MDRAADRIIMYPQKLQITLSRKLKYYINSFSLNVDQELPPSNLQNCFKSWHAMACPNIRLKWIWQKPPTNR